ncbi:MAG TPA: thermonuclease family protein [Candidatus Saccharimonadales bacterium]|nr:thermonuclease family protein [Candidatus Saccharimonadales bacterium]
MTRRKAYVSMIITAAIFVLAGVSGKTYLDTNPIVLPNLLGQSQPAPAPGYYRVVKVSDGDTIAVDMNGKHESVRMIGVDTPETHKPNTPVQCFGPEASDFTHKNLDGKNIRLEADPTNDNRDRYDRLLRYVYLEDGTLYQRRLIAEGYGFAYTSFPFQKKDDFIHAQTEAQTQKRGLWTACKTSESGGRWQTL